MNKIISSKYKAVSKTAINFAGLLAVILVSSGCTTKLQTPDLGGIYNDLIQSEDPDRNPVIVIPGVLGSKLRDDKTNEVVWGAFGSSRTNPSKPDGARLVALPMEIGKNLYDLEDDVLPDGVLDQVEVNFAVLDLKLKAYFHLLATLGAAYQDKDLGESGAIEYGDDHYSCFQFAYDWRRDIVDSAQSLHEYVLEYKEFVQKQKEKKYGINDPNVKFDIVAHSMGGLVARYYLRYGNAELPEDGSLPPLTWAGAKHIDNIILVATPNAGSVDSFQFLTEGRKFAPFFGGYEPAILGTMPSLYQLLPRARHGAIIDASTGESVPSTYDSDLWEKNGWGLANPDQDDLLKVLLPEVDSAEKRREIALDHQRKSLQRAGQFAAALDVPAEPPESLSIYLIAGDAKQTDSVVLVDENGIKEVVKTAPGDGTVLRSSALMDERIGSETVGRLQSPIAWDGVNFLFTDHIGITKDPGFADNLLFYLFQK